MHVIGKMLDAAMNEESELTAKRGPMNMLELLKDEFTMEDLITLIPQHFDLTLFISS